MTLPLIAGVGRLDPLTAEVAGVLTELGVAFPGRMPDDLEMPFPHDLTTVSLMELGELHSYWTAQYSRTTSIHGVVVAQKRSLKFEIGRLRAFLPEDKRQSQALEERRLQLEAEYARADAADVMLNGIADGQKRYVDACSRELTRRSIEAQLAR